MRNLRGGVREQHAESGAGEDGGTHNDPQPHGVAVVGGAPENSERERFREIARERRAKIEGHWEGRG
jgi:hypothetical protein